MPHVATEEVLSLKANGGGEWERLLILTAPTCGVQ